MDFFQNNIRNLCKTIETYSTNSSSVKIFASEIFSLKNVTNSFQSSSTKTHSGIPHWRNTAKFYWTNSESRMFFSTFFQ